jgi:hypothetical protein
VVVLVRSRTPAYKYIPSPRAIEIIEKKYRHRCLDGYPQIWETGTKSSLQKFSQLDVSTSNSNSSRESLVGKEGEGMGKLRSRNAPDNNDDFRPTYNSPPRSPTSLVEIWCSHDGSSLRQRNPPSKPPWPQEGDSTEERAWWRRELLFEWERQHHILFLHFALVQWGRKA